MHRQVFANLFNFIETFTVYNFFCNFLLNWKYDTQTINSFNSWFFESNPKIVIYSLFTPKIFRIKPSLSKELPLLTYLGINIYITIGANISNNAFLNKPHFFVQCSTSFKIPLWLMVTKNLAVTIAFSIYGTMIYLSTLSRICSDFKN